MITTVALDGLVQSITMPSFSIMLRILWHIFVKSVKYCIFGMEIADVQIHTEITKW